MAHQHHSHFEMSGTGHKLGDAKEFDTEPLEDIDEFGNSLIENQIDTVHRDTEELHDLDSENSETQQLDGYETEVVPDSDDEVMDSIKCKRFPYRSGRTVERVGGNMCKVKSQSYTPWEQQDNSNVCIDACGHEGHVEGQALEKIVYKGNEMQSTLQASELHVKDSVISEVKDADLANSVACHASSANDSKQLSEEVKVDENAMINYLKTRKVSIVYTRKRSRTTCNFKSKDLDEEIRSPNKCNEYAGLSYVDSQEPEDLSKVLLFVDQYVSVNVVEPTPVADVTIKETSPPALSAKGAQNLVRWADLRNKTGETGIFEWDQSEGQSDSSGNRVQLSLRGKKYDQKYMRRSPSVKEQGNGGILQKEKADNLNNNEELEGLTGSDAKLAVYDITRDTIQVHGQKAIEKSDSVLKGESLLIQLEARTIHNESEYAYDVGIDTQMAAEAMQELSFAAPVSCSNADTDECPQEMPDASLRGSHKGSHVQAWSFPKKARSASREIANQPKDRRTISCFGDQEGIMQASEIEVRRNMGKLSTTECLNERSFEDDSKVKLSKKPKMKGVKRVHMDGLKENMNSLVSDEDMPLYELERGRKHKNIYPLTGNLNSSSLFNMNEEVVSLSTGRKVDSVKVGLNDKRKEMGALGNMLESSDQTKNCSKLLYKKSRNTRNTKVKVTEEDRFVVDDPTINRSVSGKNDRKEIDFHDHGKDKGVSADLLEASRLMKNQNKLSCKKRNDAENTKSIEEDTSYVLGRSKNWYWRDYPRGKRTCRSVLGCFNGSSYLDNASLKFSREECNHYPLRSQFDSDSCFISPVFGSKMKRKQRSSVYISPCWSLSQKNCDESLLRQCFDDPRQVRFVYNDNATKKKINISEQLTDNIASMRLDKTDNMGSVSSVHERRKSDPRLAPKNIRKSHDSNLSTSPNCPQLINEMIEGYHEQPGKGKATISPLTRELARLGFRKSLPEFKSKYTRRRKTMANIRVLLSQNLDKGTSKQQKKIVMRLGLSMASCPSDATHFVTDEFARTRNMLEFIARGKPVVTHMWLESCEQAGFYIDERNYILRDMKKELELGFKLPRSLDQARQHPLLKCYRVLITPNTQPGREMLTSLVKASHGQVVDVPKDSAAIDKMVLDDLLILSCEEDHACCVPFLKRGAAAYSPELLLNGIIIQKLELKRHQLFKNHVNKY